MAFHVRDPETDALVRKLARKKGIGLTEAIREAVAAELKRQDAAVPLQERLRAIAARHGRLGERVPDKAFFDELSGN